MGKDDFLEFPGLGGDAPGARKNEFRDVEDRADQLPYRNHDDEQEPRRPLFKLFFVHGVVVA